MLVGSMAPPGTASGVQLGGGEEDLPRPRARVARRAAWTRQEPIENANVTVIHSVVAGEKQARSQADGGSSSSSSIPRRKLGATTLGAAAEGGPATDGWYVFRSSSSSSGLSGSGDGRTDGVSHGRGGRSSSSSYGTRELTRKRSAAFPADLAADAAVALVVPLHVPKFGWGCHLLRSAIGSPYLAVPVFSSLRSLGWWARIYDGAFDVAALVVLL